MSEAAAFLDQVLEFIEQSGMSKTAFGIGAVGDPNFVHDLSRGRSVSLRLVDKVRSFMRGYEPCKNRSAGDGIGSDLPAVCSTQHCGD